MNPDDTAAFAFRRRVDSRCAARVIRHPRARLNGAAGNATPAAPRGSVIGICAPRPGVRTPSQPSSPAFRPAFPILVVQHIAAGFSEGLARGTPRAPPVRLAEDGAKRRLPGVTLAPDGADLILGPNGILTPHSTTPAALHRPSGDVLLRSIAKCAQSAGVLREWAATAPTGSAPSVRSAGRRSPRDERPRPCTACHVKQRSGAMILPIGRIAEA